MDLFGSAEGSLGVAIAALLIVLGYRFARPSSVRSWIALAAYIGAIATTFLRTRGVIGGRPLDVGIVQRIAGAVVLVVGLLIAGSAAKARMLRPADGPVRAAGRRWCRRVWMGLVVVLVGFLARAPSSFGAIATGVAAVIAAWATREDAE